MQKLLFILVILSCAPDPTPVINLVPPPANTPSEVVASINGEKISNLQLEKGIEVEIFDLEEKIFNLKMDRLRVILTEKFMNEDGRKGKLTNDEYFEKYIGKNTRPLESEVKAFIKTRGIANNQLNPELIPKIEAFLAENMKKKALQKWLDNEMSKRKIEVYFKKPVRPVFDVKIGNAPILGDKNAKVTLISYTDFQCPFSKKGSEIVKELHEYYGDKIKIVHKNFPLPFHGKAKEMALGGQCAREQGNTFFWRFYYKLFENQSFSTIEDVAKEVGLNNQQFSKCLASKKFMPEIDQELQEAINIGIKSTPTFFVNGKIINGAHNIDLFKNVIDEEMKLKL